MKYLNQFLIILAFSFAGELLNWLLPLPVPASIYGIVLLFGALKMKYLKVSQIREASTLLIAAIPITLIPSAVGIIDAWDVLSETWLQYSLITVVSTFVVMAVAAVVTQKVIQRKTTKP